MLFLKLNYSTVGGIDKVLANRGGYAFVISSDLVDYQVDEQRQIHIIFAFKVARNYQFTQIGKMFWPRGGYGLALASGNGDDEYGDAGDDCDECDGGAGDGDDCDGRDVDGCVGAGRGCEFVCSSWKAVKSAPCYIIRQLHQMGRFY